MFMIINMREPNITGLDLNLVPALDALLRRRSVTRAAVEVGLSQPAMSRALARLRELQGDPLLVRARNGYVLTPRAQAIRPQLTAAMGNLRDVFRQQGFDPLIERRTLRLAAADMHAVVILPGVVARLAAEAPSVALRVEPYAPDVLERLEGGTLDLAFALSSTSLPPGVYSEIVAEDRLSLVMRRGHPAAGHDWSIAEYAEWQHVGVALLGDGRSEIDAVLARSAVTRRIGLVTPYFTAALAAVACTDMVTTISAALARRFATTLDLLLQAPPFGETRLQSTLVCSHVQAGDPFLAWFRGVVRAVATTSMAA